MAESPPSTLRCTSCDIQTEFLRMCGGSSQSTGIGWEDMILPGVENPPRCMDPRNHRQSEWDQKLGNIECVCSLYNKMRCKWDDVYLLRGVPNIYRHSVHLRYPCISIHPPSLLKNVLGGCDRECLVMCLETETVWTQRCTWRPGSHKLGDALGDQDRVNWDLKAMVDWVWRCTWRLWSSEIGGVLGGRHSGGGSSGGRCDGSWETIHWLNGNCGNV